MPAAGTISVVGYSFGFVFTLWPLLVLSPLRWQKGNILGSMILIWSLMLFGWLFARSVSPRPLVLLIPEPLNTYLFFLTGLGLLLWAVSRTMSEERFVRATSSTRNPTNPTDIPPAQLERMVLELYQLRGYRAERIDAAAGPGGDLSIHTRDGKEWLVRCKRWGGPVGEAVVRDFWSRLQEQHVDGGILITTGIFARDARDWARTKPISLMEGEEFLNAWRQARKI